MKDIRNSIKDLSWEMETCLEKNDYKGFNWWLEEACTDKYLKRKLMKKVAKLCTGTNNPNELCVDIACYAMMVRERYLYG